MQRRVQNVRNCSMACDACEENTRWSSSQSNLWRDCKMQRTHRVDVLTHTPLVLSLKALAEVRHLMAQIFSKQLLQRVPQCSHANHNVRRPCVASPHGRNSANKNTEQMNDWSKWRQKMCVNLRPPSFLPSYGGHVASLVGVGPKLQCRVTPPPLNSSL